MGKTTVMQSLADAAPGQYGEFVTFTSRPPRASDNKTRYVYYPHTDAGLKLLIDRIRHRDVVQYNVNPFNLYMYGSDIAGYPYANNLGDIFASSVDDFRRLGFGKAQFFTVVAPASLWLERFNERFAPGDPQRAARLQEAVTSLQWSLAQTDPDHTWVINDRPSRIVAAEVISYIRGSKTLQSDQIRARGIATNCLEAIKA